MLPPNNRRSCAGLLIPLPPGLAFSLVRPPPESSLRIPAYGVFKNANHRPQHALRFCRTKAWRRPRLHPNPSMHSRIGPAIQIVRKMAGSGAEPQILVQYLVLRKDLSQAPFSWPTGALVAQACHAATAALHLHRDHPHTAAYLRELGRMRKVVLEAADETTLKELAETLQQKNIDHMLWLEQPENIATCIALRPYPKEEVSQYLKKFRLFK